MTSSYSLPMVDVGNDHESSTAARGSTVSFHAVSYFVDVPATDRRCGACCTAPKQILHDVSGIFPPGTNAILGPSGCGKTTLLDALAGCIEPSRVTGTVLVDGHRRPKNSRFMTGYVLQDDVVMGTLTVRENLMFSANLRLPDSLSRREKCHRVEETIQELGLTSCANTKIGTEFIRGVSGGERKRTNIGMELVTSPDILFMDEPTTGLDSSTANAVMLLLYRLSRRGRTIIFSIHQPGLTIFNMFDRLLLLADGYRIFHGPASEAMTFFQSIGYVCTDNSNPSIFFLDVINGDSTAIQSQQGQTTANDSGSSVAEDLSKKFYTSTWAKATDDTLHPMIAALESTEQTGVKDSADHGQYVTSFCTQFVHVSKRTFLHAVRNPETSLIQIVLSTLFALLLGIVYLRQDDSHPAGLQNRAGALFLMAMYQMLSNVTVLEALIEQRAIFIHESAMGFYRVSVYFLAKIFCDLIPMRFIPLCPFSAIVYFMIGLRLDVVKFFLMFLTLFLTAMGGACVCLAVSAGVRVFAVANLISNFIFIVMMLFGGLLVNVTTLEDWLSWLKYLSLTRYSLNALSIIELDGMTFYYVTSNDTFNGSEYLTEQGIAHDTDWDFWRNIFAIGVMGVAFMIISYVQLRRVKKLK